MDTPMLTRDEAKALVKDAVTEAIKAINTVDDAARPAAVKADPTVSRVNLRRYGLPRLGKAMKAGFKGTFNADQQFEKDVSQATASLFGYNGPDGDEGDDDGFATKSSRSIFWPKTRAEFAEVLMEMGERGAAKSIDQVDMAIRAMTEASTVSITANTNGGVLVPPQFLQDQFEYALTSTIALRQVPGVRTLPVTSNIVLLPRESTTAGGSTAAEAGTLNAQDAVLAQQQITIQKQYGYRLFSNELYRDANPAWMEFLANTLVRDVALVQDLQYLDGSGSGSNITGLISYSGTTTGPNLGTNGRSPTFDDFMQAQYLLRVANAEPDFVIAHPRVLNSLQQIKDANGNYLMSNIGGYGRPTSYGTGLEGSPPKALLIGQLGMYFSSQLNIARTVGSSTDATTIIVGQGRYIVILERQGIEVAFSEHIAFNTDQTAARAIARSAVAVTQPKALTTITGARP